MYLEGHWHYDRDHDHEVLVATTNIQGDPIIVTLTTIILITRTMTVVIHWILKDNSRVSSPSSRCDGAFWSRKLLPHTRLRIIMVIMMMMVMIMKIMIKLIMMLDAGWWGYSCTCWGPQFEDKYLQVVKPKGSLLVVAKAELPSENIQCVPEIWKIKSNKICVPKSYMQCVPKFVKSPKTCVKRYLSEIQQNVSLDF